MAEKLIHIFKGIMDLLFPRKCLGCGIKNDIFCRKCMADLPPASVVKNAGFNVMVATSYQDDVLKKAILLLKYKGVKILAESLAELIYSRLETNLRSKIKKNPSSFAIIPIPLSKKRLRERGYNQAELIAKRLSDRLSVIILNDVLYKIKDTPSQVEIKNREKRLKNLEGAFGVKEAGKIAEKTIILVDDISTTGATLKEAGKALKAAGAKKIIGLVVAKG